MNRKIVNEKCKKISQKWLLIGNLALIALIIIGAVSCGSSHKKNKWTDVIMYEVLPEPPSGKGKLYENSDEEFYLSIRKVSTKEYRDYKEACIRKGFTVDATETSLSYEAYNEEGYFLELSQSGSGLRIRLKAPLKWESISWPKSKLGQHLPKPDSTMGNFSYEYEDHFFLYVGNTGKADYDSYVAACINQGFTVGYEKRDTYYRADDEDGCNVMIEYKGNNTMTLEARASSAEEKEKEITESGETDGQDAMPGETKDATEETDAGKDDSHKSSTEEPASKTPAEDKQPAESKQPTESETPAESPADKGSRSGMRSDFKEAMDSYEAFMDEYVAFLKKYSENPTDINMLSEYADFMSRYADMIDKFDKWESSDMNDAELAYYLEVQARVSRKLLKASQD